MFHTEYFGDPARIKCLEDHLLLLTRNHACAEGFRCSRVKADAIAEAVDEKLVSLSLFSLHRCSSCEHACALEFRSFKSKANAITEAYPFFALL